MADELNNSNAPDSPVSPDTDDLDAFNDLFHGRVKEASEPKAEQEEKEVEAPAEEAETEAPENEEASDDDNVGPDEEDEVEEKAPKKTGNRFQDRINELTAKAREAERRAEETAKRLAELEAKQTPTPDSKPAASVKEDSGPTPDDLNEDGSDKYPLGEFDPQYIRDLTRHTIQAETAEANKRAEQERNQRTADEAREALQEQWVTKVTSVVDDHPDFVERTMELEDTFEGLDAGYSDYLVQTIKSLEHGPEVLYHFANNLDEAQKFVKLGPLAATLALGEMNARFRKAESEQQKPAPTKVVSKAPTPPPTNKGSKTRVSVTPDTDDLDAFSDMFFTKPGRRR